MVYCRVYINCHLFLSWFSGLEILYPDPTQNFLFSGLGSRSPFCPGWCLVSICKDPYTVFKNIFPFGVLSTHTLKQAKKQTTHTL